MSEHGKFNPLPTTAVVAAAKAVWENGREDAGERCGKPVPEWESDGDGVCLESDLVNCSVLKGRPDRGGA